MEQPELITIYAWCPDLPRREEKLAERIGTTREDLFTRLSHGICKPCVDKIKTT